MTPVLNGASLPPALRCGFRLSTVIQALGVKDGSAAKDAAGVRWLSNGLDA